MSERARRNAITMSVIADSSEANNKSTKSGVAGGWATTREA